MSSHTQAALVEEYDRAARTRDEQMVASTCRLKVGVGAAES